MVRGISWWRYYEELRSREMAWIGWRRDMYEVIGVGVFFLAVLVLGSELVVGFSYILVEFKWSSC